MQVISLCAVAADELVLAERGRPADYTIVLPAKPSASQKYAAAELQAFTERLTGVRLPIATAPAAHPAKAILLGCATEKRLGTDGFRLRADGTTLEVIASDVRGTLYGVYEILETYGGCRWYSSWHTVVPKLSRLAVPARLDDVQVPAFPHREPFWFDMFNGDFAARNRANGPSMKVEEKHGGPAGRFGGGLGNCHTMQALLPSSRYGAEHPEYFALRDGERLVAAPGQSDDFATQPCLTNPDVLRIVTSNVLARIRRDPTATYYGVSQNDNEKFCTCPACAAIDAEEESHAGTMVRFVNAVAEAVEREYPDKIIEFLAYRYTRKPPKLTKLRPNVMPCLCSIECDFSRPLDESAFPANVSFVSDMKGWAAQAKRLYVWDYVTDFHNYPAPMANVYALQGNTKFMRDNGVQAYFTQGDRQGSFAGFSDLKAWLLAKWMWNPERPMKPLLDDFFAGCYGPAAPYVREYFERVHAYTRAYTAASPEHALFCEPPGLNKGVPNEYWAEAGTLLDKAAAAVASNEAYAFNVRFVRFGADYMRLETMRRWHAPVLDLSGSTTSAAAVADLSAAAKRALSFVKDHPTVRLCSSQHRQNVMLVAWRRLERQLAPRTDGVLEDELIGINPDRRITRVKDVAAVDGSALRFANPAPRWGSMTEMNNVAFKPGTRYRLVVRARLDAPFAEKGHALTAGIYCPQKKKSQAVIAVPVAKLSTSYQEFVSAPFSPEELDDGAYLYLGDGYFKTTAAESPHPVFVDNVRFEPYAEMRVGIIGCDTSHAVRFTEIMNVSNAAFSAGFRVAVAYQWGSKDIVSCTNRYEKHIAQLKKMGVEMTDSVAELLGKCDVVCLETCDGREHLAQAIEVFKSGKRVFIDKPIAHDYANARKIYEAGRAYGATYFSSSALRYADAQQACRAGTYGKIVGCEYFAPSPIEVQGTHSRYTWYGIHGFEPVMTVMGRGVASVRAIPCGDLDVIVMTWKDGRVATLRAATKSWQYGGYAIPAKGKPVALGGYEGYEKLLRQVVAFFRTGVVPVPNEETLELFAVMDAAEKSYRANGAEVPVAF